ncbi:MAG: hypothetical protein GC157_11655 [Frankiales bacterium]|nr:hypothetical protein [Frankiales bacterium]
MTWLYAASAAVVLLVATWFLRHRIRPSDVAVPRWWRLSGVLVWAALLLGGFTGVASLLSPLLSGLTGTPAAVIGGGVFGLVVALVVVVGAGLAFYADTDMWKWAALFQVIALVGNLGAAASTGQPAYTAFCVVPLAGLVALVMAFRDPPAPTKPPPPPARRRRR